MENESVSRKLLLRSMALCLAVSILAFACPEGTTAQTTTPATPTIKTTPRYGGILKRCYDNDAQQLGNPTARPFDLTSVKISRPAIETLLRYDEKGVPVPWLAKDYLVSKDLRSVTLTLQNGVKFHDGTNCNAEAVKWNLERYRTSDNPELKTVASIDVLNDSTIRLNLSKWDSTLLGNLASYAGMMISPKAYETNGGEWCRTHPIGTGPFKFVRWERDVRIKYEKFDGYWQKGKPYLDGIEWIIIRDSVSRLAAFKRGEIDDLSNVEPKDVKDLKASGEYYGSICELSALASCILGDSAHPSSPFADLRVRRAIEHAVDKQALADTFTHGLGKISDQYAPPKGWGNNPNVVGYPYNPNKAKQLLAEAGYPNGFKTKIITPSIAFFLDPLTAVQAYLDKVGIVVELETTAPPRHTSILRGGWQNALVVHNAPMSEPDTARNLAVNFSCRSFSKGTMLCPEDYENAITEALAAGDVETKKKWTWEAQKLLIDKYALANFFFTQPRITFMHNRVRDTGVGVTVDVQWTPEDSWIEQ